LTIKKSKIFISPNRYAALCSNDFSDNVFNTPTNSVVAHNEKSGPAKHNIEQPKFGKQDVTPMAPPFYISNISNFFAFTNELTRFIGPDVFTFKSTKSFLIIYLRGVLNYNTILTHLKETDASFHTFQSRVNRSFRVAIRNLHHSTWCMEISVTLSEEGHSVTQVYNVKSKNNAVFHYFLLILSVRITITIFLKLLRYLISKL
jgi:hypothetical protein